MSRRSWLVGFIGFSLLFLITSGWMVNRVQNDELWGKVPLIQLSSGWFAILFLLGRKALLNRKVTNAFALSTLTALLLGLGFPPLPLTFLLFLGFVPLLLVLDDAKDFSTRHRFLLIYHALLLWNIFSTYWVANSSAYAAGIFANTVNALVMTIPLFSYQYIKHRLGERVALLGFVASWTAFEFLHMHWDLYWPWLTLGNGLAKIHWAIQWYEFTGVLGGSVWILAINYIIYQMVRESKFQPRAGLLMACLVLPLALGLYRFWSYSLDGDEIEVVVVQPNFEPHYEKFKVTQEAVADRVLELAEPYLTSETDFLVLPETSFSRIDVGLLKNPNYFTVFNELRSRFPRLKITFGIGGYRILEDAEDIARPTTRSFETRNGIVYVEEYNAAVQIDEDGSIDEYYKALFVPGAEFFPFRKFLFFLRPIVDKLGGTLQGYRTRTRNALFQSEAAIVAPPICYESIFGEYMNQFVKKGAETIFIMTNDGWWDNTAGHKQHAVFAKLRAIETRRTIARSANMGTTCFIDARGRLLQGTDYGIAGARKGRLTLNSAITFYVRWGDVLGRVSVFIVGLLLLRSLVLKLTGSRHKDSN